MIKFKKNDVCPPPMTLTVQIAKLKFRQHQLKTFSPNIIVRYMQFSPIWTLVKERGEREGGGREGGREEEGERERKQYQVGTGCSYTKRHKMITIAHCFCQLPPQQSTKHQWKPSTYKGHSWRMYGACCSCQREGGDIQVH